MKMRRNSCAIKFHLLIAQQEKGGNVQTAVEGGLQRVRHGAEKSERTQASAMDAHRENKNGLGTNRSAEWTE
jgi:hypothetical protein